MTRAEWEASADPEPMLAAVPADRHQRELRRFSTACARRIWPLLDHPALRAVVEAGERYADGSIGLAELRQAVAAAEAVVDPNGSDPPTIRDYAASAALDASSEWPRTAGNVWAAVSCAARAAAASAADRVPDSRYDEVHDRAWQAELAAQTQSLRELIPFPGEGRSAR